MSTPRTTGRAGSRRARSALVALLAGVLATTSLLAAVATPAVAGPVDAGWDADSASGVPVDDLSDGSSSAAAFSYNADNRGFFDDVTFSTTATASSANGSPVRVPWTWQGLHAWFQVEVHLEQYVVHDGVETSLPLLDEGPQSCCVEPSNGFVYGGVAEFAGLAPGDEYGFRLAGRNSDYNNFLRGTFTLSTKPYIDATIGTDNRQWTGATEIPTATLPATTTGRLEEPGEARWYKFRVVPGQKATVDLSNLPADYDVALYGDIQQSFDQYVAGTDLTQLAASAAAGAPGSESQVPVYDELVTTIPTSDSKPPTTTQFAPRIYAPRIYAPRIYAPRIYAPRIYAPRIYAPRIYAPDSFVPDLSSNDKFRDAFSAAQNQALLAMSANTDQKPETVTASTGNTQGFYYIRVQGHDDQVFDAERQYTLTLDIEGGEECRGLQSFSNTPTMGSAGNPQTVILTDTNKLRLGADTAARQTFTNALDNLAAATGGVVVDVSGSPRVVELQDQVDDHPTCPYATTLVAQAIQDVVQRFRGDATEYVVLAGGDEVIPFFRYPDTSGLGEEKSFIPPVLDDTPAGGSLMNNQVLGQDAYGASAEITLNGLTVPVPDLAVGRLVKTPDEIRSTIEHYLALDEGTLPAPDSSLVTGYDFLADAAGAVHEQFEIALPGLRNDKLIAAQGTPYDQSWSDVDLAESLLGDEQPNDEDLDDGNQHDLVYLAGHFSANDTLAADFRTEFTAAEIAPYDPETGERTAAYGELTDTLVLSAGCHSGYTIVDTAAVPGETDPYDWTQAMAQQHAVLIGGTGYQYGDTDFLEYSERLYLNVTKRLREGPDQGPIAVGRALSLAKQDYLASLTTFEGIDQKSVLQATLYGLPMTGFDAPGRQALESDTSDVDPVAVDDNTPGGELGLSTYDFHVDTPSFQKGRASGADTVIGFPAQATWRQGADGVVVQPGAPALPKQVENVTVDDLVLRGVGFRGGRYADTPNQLPLTGAPAIEGSTPRTTFESPVFWPQSLVTPNYFGALGESGRTSLVITPAQYRDDTLNSTSQVPLNVERAYTDLDLKLFYSGTTNEKFGQNQPSLAAAPAISDVHAVSNGSRVKFSARVTGDPSAGVQEVWVTWTGSKTAAGTDSGYGRWQSIDLRQNADDSTLWTATVNLPAGQSYDGMRFLVQGANGVGAVGFDTGEGDGYPVALGEVAPSDGNLTLIPGTPDSDSPLGLRAKVTDGVGGAALAGRTVKFTVSRSGVVLSQYAALSDADGFVTALFNGPTPSGRLQVRVDLYDVTGQQVIDSQTVDVVLQGLVLSTSAPWLATRAGTAFGELSAYVNDRQGPVAGVPVTFTLPSSGVGATFEDGTTTAMVLSDLSGEARAPAIAARAPVGAFQLLVSADGADEMSVPMASQYAFTPFNDPVNNNGSTRRNPNANVPVAAGALLADGTRVSDSVAASLVQAKRVQLRWRELNGTTWVTKDGLVTYDAVDDVFRANLKSPSLGLAKGRTYVVQLRVLPSAAEPKPLGTLLQSDFDLGHRSFELSLS